MSSKSSKSKKKEVEKPVLPQNTGPVTIDPKTGNIQIKILAKPGAKTNGITDISDEGVGCQIGMNNMP